MAEFIQYDSNCRYCKGTGMVDLVISSKPCLDCKKEMNYTNNTNDIDNMIKMTDCEFEQSDGQNI